MMSALFTALREGGMDDALQHLAATQRERDEARQRVAQLERRVTDLLDANNREVENRRFLANRMRQSARLLTVLAQTEDPKILASIHTLLEV